MERDELSAACDDFVAAKAAWSLDQTPAALAAASLAMRRFIEALSPVVGHQMAFRYEASWQAFENAIERESQLTARMAVQPTFDETDAQLMRQLARERADALNEFERVGVEREAALDEAQARDKKGGA